jgi:hypothetical protein
MRSEKSRHAESKKKDVDSNVLKKRKLYWEMRMTITSKKISLLLINFHDVFYPYLFPPLFHLHTPNPDVFYPYLFSAPYSMNIHSGSNERGWSEPYPVPLIVKLASTGGTHNIRSPPHTHLLLPQHHRLPMGHDSLPSPNKKREGRRISFHDLEACPDQHIPCGVVVHSVEMGWGRRAISVAASLPLLCLAIPTT